MLVDGCESRLRFDDVEVEKRGEAGQCEDEVRFDDRVAVWTDLPVAHRLPDEAFNQCAPIAESEANLFSQRWIVHGFEDVGRVHAAGGTRVGSEGEQFREGYSQHVARVRGVTKRP